MNFEEELARFDLGEESTLRLTPEERAERRTADEKAEKASAELKKWDDLWLRIREWWFWSDVPDFALGLIAVLLLALALGVISGSAKQKCMALPDDAARMQCIHDVDMSVATGFAVGVAAGSMARGSVARGR